MNSQLPLEWPEKPDYSAESFVASAGAEDARRVLAGWRDWPGRAMALIGPEGAGKTHLAAIWRDANAGADVALAEDADRAWEEGALFALLERAATGDLDGLLLTARTRPAQWRVALPDLASRARALAYVELLSPDDAALSQILRKLLRDRQVRVKDGVISYLAARIERSPAAARRAAELLDRLAPQTGGKVQMETARRALAQMEGETRE